MNSIKSIRLENFQSHLDTKIDLSPGLNVIVGQSDSGKTSILRGIRWVLFNQPRGTDMKRVGADFVRVTLTLSDDVKIIRERTSSKNRYIIKKPKQDDLILEGFGVHVPQEVLDTHQIKPLRIDRDHELILHISQQLDGPFLLEQTSNVRAKTIGRISGAHFLDIATRETTKDVSKLQIALKENESQVDNIIEKLNPFSFLDDANRQIKRSQESYKELVEKNKRSEHLSSILKKLSDINIEKEKIDHSLQIVEEVDRWEYNIQSVTQRLERRNYFSQKYNQKVEMESNIAKCQSWLEKTGDIDLAKKEVERIQSNLERNKLLGTLLFDLTTTNKACDKLETIVNQTTFIREKPDERINGVEEKWLFLNKLEKIKTNWDKVKSEHNNLISFTNNISILEIVEEKISKVINSLAQYENYKQKSQTLLELNHRINEGKQYMNLQVEKEREYRTKYEALLIEKGTCPTCGGKVDSTHVHHLLS